MFDDVSFSINCLIISLKGRQLKGSSLPALRTAWCWHLTVPLYTYTAPIKKKPGIFFPHANNFLFMIIAHRILKHLPLGFLMKYCRGCFLTESQLLLTSSALSGCWYHVPTFSHLISHTGSVLLSKIQQNCWHIKNESFESGSISLRKPGKFVLT